MPLPRMRTAEGVLKEILAADPSSAVSLHFIRSLISSGRIPFVPAGRRKLVNVDEVIAYLERGETPAQGGDTYGTIRRVSG